MDNSGVLNLASFFGADAEVDFGLPSGKEFLNNTLLCNDFKSKYGRHLKNHFGKKKYFHSYNYSQYHINTEKNIFKIMLENLLYKKYESRALKDFKEAERQVFKIKSIEAFKKIITGEITDYKEIENTSPKLAEVLSDYKNDLSQIFTVSSAGVLDKYFPSIANPNKFPSQNFSKIFNYYWNCYFLLVEKITEAFHQLQKLLHKSDVLVVLGYNFNEDDNHVNSFIHSFVSSGKKLVFVTDNDEAKCRLEILQKLRLAKEFEGNIVPVKVSYGDNQQVVLKYLVH